MPIKEMEVGKVFISDVLPWYIFNADPVEAQWTLFYRCNKFEELENEMRLKRSLKHQRIISWIINTRELFLSNGAHSDATALVFILLRVIYRGETLQQLLKN